MAHYAMGYLRRLQSRLAESRSEYEKAVTLDPNNSVAYAQLGTTLRFSGDPEAAIPYIEKAIRLNPRDPNIGNRYRDLAVCQLLLGRVDEAVALLREARAANPRFWLTYLELAGALGLRGDIDEAKATLAEWIKLRPEINSLARFRADVPFGNPQYWALREKTINVGLRRAGFPDE
jgi:adenylate cyclase